MTKEFAEKTMQIPKISVLTPSSKEVPMSKLEKTTKMVTSTHMNNISKMMSDLNATHKTMKLNLTKLKA
jgi:hypothetical protein